jgi:hypothetical protein
MPQRKVVKGTVRRVNLRVGVGNLTFRTTEGLEGMLAYLMRKGYFMTTSEAIRFAIFYLYLTIRQLEEGAGRGGQGGQGG